MDKNRQRNIEIFSAGSLMGKPFRILPILTRSAGNGSGDCPGIKIEVRVLVSGRWKALPALGGA